ncbi:phospholipid carrier-dependent glycosyltransferase [Desulfonatronum sp. SC1]|uniref:phospholipid carrier-dependent glycosyltransferase n=1 Tax=Desulfonatronum sp. SC1 TaxID=2109626 RepID=UPI001304F589|nr:phospholipid carrier-dependent glycosyltransferase [Desulfonatronum sp. SC1]
MPADTLFSRFKLSLLLAGIFLAIYILPLGVRPLAVPDEARYAEIPREMIATGNWIAPHLNGVRYFEKPVLGYWLKAGSMLLLGENNFAVRFPSALAVGLSTLLVYLLVLQAGPRREDEANWSATLAALAFLTFGAMVGIGTFAVLDSLFTFFLTAAITAFFFATEAEPTSTREKRFLVLSGVACGLAFLTKGFLAFVVPVLALVPYLCWQGRWRDIWRMGRLPLLAAVLTALPWSVAVHVREPDFWRFFIWNEHIHRFLFEEKQRTSFWQLLWGFPGLVMPWAVLGPAALLGLRDAVGFSESRKRLARLSLCWLALPFLFVSASSDKLLTYLLPCLPPVAVLLALGLDSLRTTGGKMSVRLGIAALASVAGLSVIALLFLHFFGYKGFFLYSAFWQTALAVSALIIVLALLVRAFKCRDNTQRILLFGLSPVALFCALPLLTPDVILQVKMPGMLLERHKASIGPDTVLVADTGTLRAVCWYLKRDDVYMLGGPGELEYGMSFPENHHRMLNNEDILGLIGQNPGNTVFVTQMKKLPELRESLPEPVFQDNSGPRGFLLLRF